MIIPFRSAQINRRGGVWGIRSFLFVDLPGPFPYLRSVISLRISIGFGVTEGVSAGVAESLLRPEPGFLSASTASIGAEVLTAALRLDIGQARMDEPV